LFTLPMASSFYHVGARNNRAENAKSSDAIATGCVV